MSTYLSRGNGFVRVLTVVALVWGLIPNAVRAQDEGDAEEYVAKTTVNPQVPVDELQLMVKPLTKDELAIEADAWQEILKAKVREISSAELAVKRKNREIKATKDSAKAVEKAQKAAEKAEKAQQKAETTLDQDAAEDAAEAAKKAEAALAEAEQASEEAKAVEEESDADVETEAAEEAAKQRAEEKKQEAAERGEEVEEEAAPVSSEAPEVQREQIADAAGAEQAANAAKEAADGKVDEKAVVLDLVTELRDQRVSIVDRMNVVLNELDRKGGEVEEYRTYVAAVSGVNVDVNDWMAAWATVKGWLLSPEGGVRWGENIIKFVLIATGFWILSFIVGKVTERGLRYTKNLSSLMREFLGKMTRRLVLVVGVIVALTALEINITPLLAVIGAAGFVIGFALQDTLGNFASGIMILVYRPFDVNDVVDVAGVSGTVAALNLVSITIKTFDNKIVVVPNNSVWNNVITNATGSTQRRVDLVFGIGYDDDISKAESLLQKIVSSDERVLKDPETVIRLHELGDSSVNFIVRPWVKTADYWPVYWDITRKVKDEFDANGISIPFPQRDVHIYQASNNGGNGAPERQKTTKSESRAAADFPDTGEEALSGASRDD